MDGTRIALVQMRMTTSAQIVETIGESGLLLPDLVADGLAANDRAKYYLTLLQTASAHARQPLDAVPDLRTARESSGVADASLDDVIRSSRDAGGGAVFIPHADDIRQRLFDDVDRMLEPLRATAAQDAGQRERFERFRTRFEAQAKAAGSWAGDRADVAAIDALVGGGGGNDTLHRLIMDLHRELNHLLENIAIETIDGAKASGLTPADRVLVGAFMAGVNQTAALKFDHPGLGTTAVRYGDHLSIQNDLGTTEGHLVVLRIADLSVTLFYSDVHPRRARFLQELLQPYDVEWQSGAGSKSADVEMFVGRYTARGAPELEQFLTFFGSRLVFLIDWNRARKRLNRFVKKGDAVAVLKWAADNNVGHRAFLQMGDAQLVYTVFERIAPSRVRYGARLDELIGRESALAFLKAVLRIASTRLAGGHSERLIQDEVEAELLTHLQTSERQILDAASEHAMLLSALAERLRRTLARPGIALAQDEIARTARLAKSWETRADEMVRQVSRSLDRADGVQALRRLLGQADDVADALEESAFLLTLVPNAVADDAVAALRPLSDFAGEGTKEYVRCLEYARDIARLPTRADVQEVLVCVDRLAELEHASDAAERAARGTLVSRCTDFRGLQILLDAARGFEQATDALARCGLTIRDYVLSSGPGHR